MTKLKNLKGTAIQFRDEDPVVYAGTWSSGGDMNTVRFLTGGAGSSNSAALAFGGRTPAPADVALTENYNGTAWTEVGDLPAVKSYAAGAGTSTAALSIGGSSPAVPATSGKSESWNGSSWTEITALGRGPTSPQSTTYGAGSGSTTSALFYASDEAGNANARTESWNGSSWTELADQNTARSYGAGVGTSNSSALLAGGLIYPPASANTEIWDGSSWTEVGDMNQGRLLYGTSSGQGSATSALIYSGRLYPPGASSALTESWDGTSWTEVNDLSTARRAGSGGGTATSAILGGGSTSGSSPGHVATTEEWSFPSSPAVQEGDMWFNSSSSTLKGYAAASGIPSTTWASGANLSSVRAQMFSYGASGPTGAVVGGDNSGDVALHEQYNGTAWTEAGDLGTARGNEGRSGSGTQTAALVYGSFSVTNIVESYNGTSWTETTEFNTPRRSAGGAGVQTATLMFGGRNPPAGNYALTEEYNGSAWTEVGDLNSSRYGGSGSGISTSALMISGYTSTYVNLVESYNGTSWSEKSEVNTIHYAAGASSSGSNNTSALVFGGTTGPTIQATTEFWNGSTWTELNDLATATNNPGGTGSSVSAFSAGGNTPPRVATVEEWNAPGAVVTVTTS